MFYNTEIETMVVIFNNKNFRHKKAHFSKRALIDGGEIGI